MENNQEKITGTIPTNSMPEPASTADRPAGSPNGPAVAGKDIAIISYITIIGLIIAFVMNSEKKTSFGYYHIRQMVGLALTAVALWIIGIIPILGWFVLIFGSIGLLILWIMGLMNAINGKEEPVPILGKKYEEWFKGIGK